MKNPPIQNNTYCSINNNKNRTFVGHSCGGIKDADGPQFRENQEAKPGRELADKDDLKTSHKVTTYTR